MGIKRHFLGWNKPFILEFSQQLLTDCGPGNSMDEILIWVPSARAGRHLENELFSDTEKVEAFHPPNCLTPAQFFRRFPEKEEVATPTQCLYAWKKVIQDTGKRILKPIFPSTHEYNQNDWTYEIAEQFMRLRARIVEENSSFLSISKSGSLHDSERWNALALIEAAYLKQLNSQRLIDPDIFFLENFQEIVSEFPFSRILLAGILNLSQRQEALLRKLDTKGIQIDIYCPCPESFSDKLDSMGRPIKGYWDRESLSDKLLGKKIQRVPSPERAIPEIFNLSNAYGDNADVLVLGTPDEEYSQYAINRSLLTSCTYYSPEGKSLNQTAWGNLISAAFRWNDSRELDSLLEILGNSLFRRWIENSGLSADSLDKSINYLKKEHLFSKYDQLLDPALGSIGAIGTVRDLIERVEDLFDSSSGARTLPESIWNFLQVIANANELTDELSRVLGQFEAILQDLNEEISLEKIQHSDQKHLFLHQLESNRFYPEREMKERPVVGWLELPWEIAPHMVIFGLPDSKIPGNSTSDTFLPPALCRNLGFYGPEEESAFHSFRLRLILEERSNWGRLDVILTDKNLNDDPVLPCRFLFQANEDELLKRTDFLLGERNYQREVFPSQFGAYLHLPDPKPLTRFSVTGFHAYLRNPFAFLLERRLRWEAPDPFLMEMNPMMFGNLAHKVLEMLNGEDAGIRLTEAKDIQGFLESALDEQLSTTFGSDLSVPLQIQRSSLQERLRAASEIIGMERKAGWLPMKVEWAFHDDVDLRFENVALGGKIDLLEKNEETGAYRIIDYKTSDKNESPSRTHIQVVTANSRDPLFPETDFLIGTKSYRWKDLQLPMYMLAAERVMGIRPQCAYLCLGKAVSEIRLDEWTPGDEHLIAAEKCAGAIIQRIKDGYFPVPEKPTRYDSWAEWFGSDYMGTIEPEWIARQMKGSIQ